MPDAITEGPWIDLIRGMGMQGMHERYQVTGERVMCECLFHGETKAKVTFGVAVPNIAGVVLQPVVLVAIQVWCWPGCGYRLAWRS